MALQPQHHWASFTLPRATDPRTRGSDDGHSMATTTTPAALRAAPTVPGGHRIPMPFPSRPPVQREEEWIAQPIRRPRLGDECTHTGLQRPGCLCGDREWEDPSPIPGRSPNPPVLLASSCPIPSRSHRHPVLPPRDHCTGDVQVRIRYGPDRSGGLQALDADRDAGRGVHTCRPSPEEKEKGVQLMAMCNVQWRVCRRELRELGGGK